MSQHGYGKVYNRNGGMNGARLFKHREGGQDDWRKKDQEEVMKAVAEALIEHNYLVFKNPPRWICVFEHLRHDAMIGNWKEISVSFYGKKPKPKKRTVRSFDGTVMGFYEEEKEFNPPTPSRIYRLCKEEEARKASSEGREVLTVGLILPSGVLEVKTHYVPSERKNVNYYYYVRSQ